MKSMLPEMKSRRGRPRKETTMRPKKETAKKPRKETGKKPRTKTAKKPIDRKEADKRPSLKESVKKPRKEADKKPRKESAKKPRKEKSAKKRREWQEVAELTTLTTSLVSCAATSSDVDVCPETEEAECKFTKATGGRNVKKRGRPANLSTRPRPGRKQPKIEKNATKLKTGCKQETGSENYMHAESSGHSQNHFPHGRNSADSFTEYLHRQMLQDPQFIFGLMEGHDKIGAQDRKERRSSLRNLPARNCASTRRVADSMEQVFYPITALLETLQGLRNSNKELEDRIAVLTARRDQLLTINDIVSDVHQSFLNQSLQNETVQEPFEDPQETFDDLQQPWEGPQHLFQDPLQLF